MGFQDVEVGLLDYLADLGHTVTSTPIDLQQRVAGGGFVIRVHRVGGGDDVPASTTDEPRVEVGVLGVGRTATHDRAELVRDRMHALPAAVNGVILDRAFTETAPVDVPYPDPDIRFFNAVYRVETRRR